MNRTLLSLTLLASLLFPSVEGDAAKVFGPMVKASAVGPPTFTNQVATAAGTNSGNTSTWTGLSLGSSTANSNRFVVVAIAAITGTNGYPTATLNGTAATVVQGGINTTNNNYGVFLVTGIIATGSTFNLVLTYSGGPNLNVASVYTSDITTMLSQTPQAPPPTNFVSNESNLSVTTSAPVAYSGSFVLMIWFGNGVSGTPTLTSDASLNVDGNYGNFAIFASANNVAASAASHATTTVTGAGENNQGMFVFR